MIFPHPPGHHRSSSSSPPRICATTASVRSNAANSSFVCTCRYRALRRPPLARHIEQRQLPRRQRNNATHDGSRRYSGVALGRMRPTGGPAATRPRPQPRASGRKSRVFDARPFAVLRRHFPCTARILALLRYRPTEWRRRESNPRPRPHRTNVYERSPRFALTRRPVRGRPTGGPAILRASCLRRLALPRYRARSLAPRPRPRAEPGGTSPDLESTRRRVRDHASHLLCVPVVLRGRPATSARCSTGEPTTSRPGRPRMLSTKHSRRCELATPAAAPGSPASQAVAVAPPLSRDVVVGPSPAASPPAVAHADQGEEHDRERDRQADPRPDASGTRCPRSSSRASRSRARRRGSR